jgi:hypothetical protein
VSMIGKCVGKRTFSKYGDYAFMVWNALNFKLGKIIQLWLEMHWILNCGKCAIMICNAWKSLYRVVIPVLEMYKYFTFWEMHETCFFFCRNVHFIYMNRFNTGKGKTLALHSYACFIKWHWHTLWDSLSDLSLTHFKISWF